jgi:hypothetical protein
VGAAASREQFHASGVFCQLGALTLLLLLLLLACCW